MGIMEKATPSVDTIMAGFPKTLNQLDTFIASQLETIAAEQDAAKEAQRRSNAARLEADRDARIASRISELFD